MKYALYLFLPVLFLVVIGCDRNDTFPIGAVRHGNDAADEALSKAGSRDASFDRIAALVDAANAELAPTGVRLDYPWLFRVGGGTDPFARLRTGVRWTSADLEYVIDASDLTADVAAADLEAALVRTFDAWNEVARSYIETTRMPDNVGPNPDVLDGTIVAGKCVSIFDVTSPNLDLAAGTISPVTDILLGGWIGPEYFELCLGSDDILGVTWSFLGSDSNGDGYPDLLYVEQFYNDVWDWTTMNAAFLDFDNIDVESVALHENGHALGLGHFGGPVNRQPLRVKPNGRVFNPEAVMNGFYVGGEKRSLMPTDVAGLTTLYTGHVATTN